MPRRRWRSPLPPPHTQHGLQGLIPPLSGNTVLDRFLVWSAGRFSSPWPLVPFSPLLFSFVWVATLVVIVQDDLYPIPFEVLATWAYVLWGVVGLGSPPLALFAYYLVRYCKRARSTLFGFWLRFAADLGQLTAMTVFFIAIQISEPWVNESQIYRRYIGIAVLIFLVTLVVRDILALVATELLARRIVALRAKDRRRDDKQ